MGGPIVPSPMALLFGLLFFFFCFSFTGRPNVLQVQHVQSFSFSQRITVVPWRRRRMMRHMEQSHSDDDSDGMYINPSPTMNNDTSIIDRQDGLLERLGETFVYEGRLPRGDVSTNRCGYVGILGAPNMGKSSLLNALLQEDLCICTSRPQTTRHAILGILSTHDTQVCFLDTPGILETPAYKLQEGMMEAVATAFRDADVLLVVTDLFSTPIPNDQLFRKVQQSSKPILVVINKIDLLSSSSSAAASVNRTSSSSLKKTKKKKNQPDISSASPNEMTLAKTFTVEEAVARWRQLLPQAVAIVPTSALQGPADPGVTAIRRLLCGGPNVTAALRQLGRPIPGMLPKDLNDPMWQDATIRAMLLPLSPPLYDTEVLTDRSERFVASEIIRAALFTTFSKELPYCCEVRITQFQEPTSTTEEPPIVRIAADIIVERESQKAIVIGQRGAQIKHVGIVAREKLQAFLDTPVHLTLQVKVNKDWRKKEDQLKLYGYLS